MEETELIDSQTPEKSSGILLLDDAQYYLQQAGKWARFLGIMGFIGAAFIALAGLFMGTLMASLSRLNPTGATAMPATFGGLMGFIYILIAVFYFFVALYLYQFGTRVKQGVMYNDAVLVTQGLGKLKSMLKMVGVATIVILSLYVLIIVAVIIGAIIGFTMVTPA